MDMSPNTNLPPRPVRTISAAMPLDEVMAALAKALAQQGPVLNFTRTPIENVDGDVAVIVETTGSSGALKLVALGRKALLASARLSLDSLGARLGATWSLFLPLNHIAGVNVLVRSLELGTTPIDLRSAKEFPSAHFTAIVPTQLFQALNGNSNLLQHLKSNKAVLVGGASLSDDLYQNAIAQDINIVCTYGMSETSGGCVYEGQPLGDTKVRISSQGLIEISGPTLATTYLGNEALWNSQLTDGWFTTTDLGEIDSQGRLTILGRADDICNSGGEKISLSLVEKVLVDNFPSAQWAAIAVDDQKWGQRLVVCAAGSQLPTTPEISSLIETSLGEIAKPKQILHLDQLPTIGIGKIDRNALAQQAKEAFSG